MAEVAAGVETRRAVPEDADVLTRIAFAAKGYWGYPDRWMERWREDLTISTGLIRESEVHIASIDGEPAGFYALTERGRTLDYLWITPFRIGSGIGRRLLEHAVARAAALGARAMEIEADPNAEGFYIRMGARRIEEKSYMMDGKRHTLPSLAVDTPAQVREA